MIGAHDAYTGLDEQSLSLTADIPLNGHAPGVNVAPSLNRTSPNIWQLSLDQPFKTGTLTVSIKDRQGNITEIIRTLPRQ